MLPVGNVSHNEAIDRFNRSFILWLGWEKQRLGVCVKANVDFT